jgi:predicted  nucleic acid-binding Zn-ribbon protein
VVDVASSAPTTPRIPVHIVDVSDLSPPKATLVPRIPVHIVDVASDAPTTQVASVAKALANELAKKLAVPQDVHETLKKLVDIQSAIKDQISRVNAQSKALLKYQQMQKGIVAPPKADTGLSIDDLKKQFDDLTKRVQSHEQKIGDLKEAVKAHLAKRAAMATHAPVSLGDLSKQFDDLTKRVDSHEEAIGQLKKTMNSRLQPAVEPSTESVCKSSPVICNAAAQLAAEIKKHTEYAHKLKALQTHIATLHK